MLPYRVQRLPDEPDASFLGLILFQEGGCGSAGLVAAARLVGPPPQVEALREAWRWDERAAPEPLPALLRSTARDVYRLAQSELAKHAARLRSGAYETTPQELLRMIRTADMATSAASKIEADAPKPEAGAGQDYTQITAEDLETIRRVLDRYGL